MSSILLDGYRAAAGIAGCHRFESRCCGSRSGAQFADDRGERHRMPAMPVIPARGRTPAGPARTRPPQRPPQPGRDQRPLRFAIVVSFAPVVTFVFVDLSGSVLPLDSCLRQSLLDYGSLPSRAAEVVGELRPDQQDRGDRPTVMMPISRPYSIKSWPCSSRTNSIEKLLDGVVSNVSACVMNSCWRPHSYPPVDSRSTQFSPRQPCPTLSTSTAAGPRDAGLLERPARNFQRVGLGVRGQVSERLPRRPQRQELRSGLMGPAAAREDCHSRDAKRLAVPAAIDREVQRADRPLIQPNARFQQAAGRAEIHHANRHAPDDHTRRATRFALAVARCSSDVLLCLPRDDLQSNAVLNQPVHQCRRPLHCAGDHGLRGAVRVVQPDLQAPRLSGR